MRVVVVDSGIFKVIKRTKLCLYLSYLSSSMQELYNFLNGSTTEVKNLRLFSKPRFS